MNILPLSALTLFTHSLRYHISLNGCSKNQHSADEYLNKMILRSLKLYFLLNFQYIYFQNSKMILDSA